MTGFRLITVPLIVAFLMNAFVNQAAASAHMWVTMGPPSSQPTPGSTFTTDLRISSWNGTVAALDLTVDYDPAVIKIIDFSTPSGSEFYSNCFTDPLSFTTGQTKIACFQTTNWESHDVPVSFGTLTWKVVGAVGSVTDIVIKPIMVVDARWSPVEVLAYGQHIALTVNKWYLPLISRNH
jgi:hypothetical protein